MTVAAHIGTSPQTVRQEWTIEDVEDFLVCLPGIRAFGHPLYGGGE